MNRVPRSSLLAAAVVALLALGGVALAGSALDFSGYDPVGAPSEPAPPTAAPTGDGRAFAIDAERSTVSFEIDEVLRGRPTTVVGSGSAVGGGFAVDGDDPADAAFGELVVDPGGLSTDSGLRDRAIRGPILGGDPIRFQPTAVRDVTDDGGRLAFALDGELTVSGATAPVTFATTVRPSADGSVTISAVGDVSRSELGITIPSVPFVAEVSDAVVLRAELVAVPA